MTHPDKTLRPDSGRQNDKTKCQAPNPQSDPTVRQTPNPQGDATLRPKDDAEQTLRAPRPAEQAGQQKDTDEIINAKPDSFILNGVRYDVIDIISTSTGEAQIYLVESGGQKSVLKLYFANLDPSPDIQILKTVQSTGDTGILVRILDCGWWVDAKTGEKRLYELMEHCSGGSLADFQIDKDEKLLAGTAVQCAGAIAFLHRKKILHRDIKPANFLFSSGREVDHLRLSDFGISIRTDQEGKAKISSQLRTKIYAAPEYYYSIDGEIQIDFKSDFFSLGMMLLVLWTGEEIFKINEYELINLKINGNLPYPEDVSDRTLQLMKALTDPNPRTRADYEDIERWVQGEDIYKLRKRTHDGFSVIFDPVKNLTATSPEELGQFMYDNPELATKYLYSGKISEWMTSNGRPDIAVEMEDIVENQFPKDKKAGHLAASYFLNMSIPYHDVRNQPLTSPEEIALSLLANSGQYAGLLTNPNDRLFIFFSYHGSRNLTEKFAPMFAKSQDKAEVLLQLSYTLYPSMPWKISGSRNKVFTCNNPEDIINLVRTETLSDNSWFGLTKESFFIWLRHLNPVAEGRIRSQKDYDKNPWCVIYNLSPKVSYNLALDENDKDGYYFTAAQVADFMDFAMALYLHDPENRQYAESHLSMMKDIEGTRLYHYLKSKGVYDDKIDWIKYCMQQDSAENSGKYGPYNWKTGIYKSIKGLGGTPSYYFPESAKYIYAIEELDAIPEEEIEKQMETGALKEWIALFFQENPDADLSEKFTYERLTVDYIDYVSDYEIEDGQISSYYDAVLSVLDTNSRLKKSRIFNLTVRIVTTLLGIASAGYASYKLLDTGMNIPFSPIWITIISLAAAGILWYKRMFEYFDSFFLSTLKAVGVFILVYILVSIVASNLIYSFILLLVAAIVLIAIFGYIKPDLDLKKNNDLFNPGFEELHLEPLHYGFRSSGRGDFRSSIGDRSVELTNKLKANTRKIIVYCLLLTGLSAGLTFLSEYLAKAAAEKQVIKERYQLLKGEYRGVFDNRPATFIITEASENGVEAEIKVQYSNLTTEKVRGTITPGNRMFHFDDLNKNNNILDGDYNGVFDEEMKSFSGKYKNYRTRKEVEFKFQR